MKKELNKIWKDIDEGKGTTLEVNRFFEEIDNWSK